MMTERIYTKEAKALLDIEDNRTFKKWCSRNGVAILCDDGCRKPYVIAEEFHQARGKAVFTYLKSLPSFQTIDKYKPSGDHEKKFLARLDF